jgi:flagellin
MKEINATAAGLEIVGDENSEIDLKLAVVSDNISFKLAEDLKLKQSSISAIGTYNNAIEKVSEMRSKLGAYQNRLEHTIKNTDNTAENLTASMSRIEDADMAIEMSEFTRLNILQQAGTAMLAQANQLPQGVLQLLR